MKLSHSYIYRYNYFLLYYRFITYEQFVYISFRNFIRLLSISHLNSFNLEY